MYNDYFVGYYDRVMAITKDNDTWVEAFTQWLNVRKAIRQSAGEL